MLPIIFRAIQDAIHVDKKTGTSVDYYIFDEYEIHVNQIRPHTVQEWHSHSRIIETVLVTKGRLLCRYLDGSGVTKDRHLGKNELVQVGGCVHTFENDTDEAAEFIVFRFVPDGADKRDMIKGDKKLFSFPETEETVGAG
ncbi:hypothetical protein D3Z51_12635 [Clostridiaceae bacterium]|nr:hypothetical protein [Clostridiaceae bacterium]RKI12223.1 hypothetical protein D7V81_12400 [bacterium 1XD21-70]